MQAQRRDEGFEFLPPLFACPHALQITGLSNPLLSPGPELPSLGGGWEVEGYGVERAERWDSFKNEGKEKQRRI